MNNENAVVPFNYKEANVRTVMIKGEPWFVAKDVCDVLEIVNTARSLDGLDADEKGVHSMNTPGGNQRLYVVNEPGLYSLILRSRKKEAKEFKRWITHEVLPTIRKTGGIYMTDGALEKTLADPDFMIQVLQNLKQVKRERDELQSLNKAVANERDNARDERDEAVRTKACISDRKTATALQTASVLTRKVKKLEQKLGIEENFMQASAIPWLKEFFGKKMSNGAWVVVGQQLKSLSDYMETPYEKVTSARYGTVNDYHRDVIYEFKHLLHADIHYCAKYRVDTSEKC